MRGLVKTFGGTRALDNASLVVRRGSVHGLIGQNGAGKSTIVNILNGLVVPEAGTIAVEGSTVAAASPRAIERLGVHIIHQEPLLVPGFTVAEALFLSDEPGRGRWCRGAPCGGVPRRRSRPASGWRCVATSRSTAWVPRSDRSCRSRARC